MAIDVTSTKITDMMTKETNHIFRASSQQSSSFIPPKKPNGIHWHSTPLEHEPMLINID